MFIIIWNFLMSYLLVLCVYNDFYTDPAWMTVIQALVAPLCLASALNGYKEYLKEE